MGLRERGLGQVLGQIFTTSGLMRRSLNTRDNSNDAGQCLNFGLRITNAGAKCGPPNDCPADDRPLRLRQRSNSTTKTQTRLRRRRATNAAIAKPNKANVLGSGTSV